MLQNLTLLKERNFATIVSGMITLRQSASQKIPVSKKDVLPNIIQHSMTTSFGSERSETKKERTTSKMVVNPQRKKEKMSKLIPIKQAK